MNNYLVGYLRDNAKNDLERKYIDYFKIELDHHMYAHEPYINIKRKNSNLRRFYNFIQIISAISSTPPSRGVSINILSTIYFPQKNKLPEKFKTISPIWSPVGRTNICGNIKLVRDTHYISSKIDSSFSDIFDSCFFSKIEQYKSDLTQLYLEYNFRALLLFTDQYFLSKLNIEIFRHLNMPSFVFSHGLPGIYSLEVDNRSDYLMVWGDKIRNNYIKNGFDSRKIFVTGHPKYKIENAANSLRFLLDNILVIPKSTAQEHHHTYDISMIDFYSMFVYLYEVQKCLTSLGVRSARFRPHSSLDANWCCKFVDLNFYKLDVSPLQMAIEKSSLLIGATSTVLLESVFWGVNYVVFEPCINGLDMCDRELVPPFDGSDDDIPVARNLDELKEIIMNKKMINRSCLPGYFAESNFDCLNDLIK